MKALLLVMLLLSSSEVAHADKTPGPSTPPAEPATPAMPYPVNSSVDTMCQNKRVEEMCKLADGSGGFCTAFQCPTGACLKCIAPKTEKPESNLWIPMLAFGVTVMIVGSVFWLRLRKLWNSSG